VQVESEYTELFPINASVIQDSVLGPLLYLLYTADLPTTNEPKIASFFDDTAVLTTDRDSGIASQKHQTNLGGIKKWLKMEDKR
jgi:hypothetical protein